MSASELLNILEDTAMLLQKTQDNLKKCPKARFTKGYIETRIKIIEEYWSTFSSTHQRLARITPKEQRFVSRRGQCSNIWSDQGRNFVGADKELKAAWTEANMVFEGDIFNKLALEGTQWHFIPAYSLNFGGLWEAGVKSVKHHLKRILTTNLTYEEMTTVLCQIEACLNSRPLSPIDDSDPDSIEPLTPGHFLIGEAPIVVPSPDFKGVKVNNLSRWQYTQKLLGDFWRRWQQEYLSRLQQRPIWLKKIEEFKIGDIVLIKTDGLPPGKWSLGRIVDKHPGDDSHTRVYSVKSGSNIIKRSIAKLCPLPIDTE